MVDIIGSEWQAYHMFLSQSPIIVHRLSFQRELRRLWDSDGSANVMADHLQLLKTSQDTLTLQKIVKPLLLAWQRSLRISSHQSHRIKAELENQVRPFVIRCIKNLPEWTHTEANTSVDLPMFHKSPYQWTNLTEAPRNGVLETGTFLPVDAPDIVYLFMKQPLDTMTFIVFGLQGKRQPPFFYPPEQWIWNTVESIFPQSDAYALRADLSNSSTDGSDCLPYVSTTTTTESFSSTASDISNKGYCGECSGSWYPCHNFV